MKNLLFVFGICLSMVSCKEEFNTPCFNEILKDSDMVKYSKGDLGCRFFLRAHRYQNDIYYNLGSHCADFEAYIYFNCDDERIVCDSSDNATCRDFLSRAEDIGIVAVKSPE